MKAKEFIEEYRELIKIALSDYQHWWEAGEDYYDLVQDALNDLNEVEDD